jgi:hypothetical protein
MELWKDSRKFPKKHGIDPNGPPVVPLHALIRMNHGKAMVTETHTRDMTDVDDDGHVSVVGNVTLRAGEYIFPRMYMNPDPDMLFVGKTADVKFVNGEWYVYLKGFLRDPNTGNLIKFEGMKIDCSGWYAESSLVDTEMGETLIRPGRLAPSVTGIIENSTNSARRHDAIRRDAARAAREDEPVGPATDPKEIAREASARKILARAMERAGLSKPTPISPPAKPAPLAERRHVSGVAFL